jgi:hypothetical protein
MKQKTVPQLLTHQETKHLVTCYMLWHQRRQHHLCSRLLCHAPADNLESVQHIFNECTFSSQLRNYIASTAPPIQENCPAYTSLASTTSIIQGGGNIYWKQMEITTIFTIWKERCRRIFQEEEQQIPEVTREILKEL